MAKNIKVQQVAASEISKFWKVIFKDPIFVHIQSGVSKATSLHGYHHHFSKSIYNILHFFILFLDVTWRSSSIIFFTNQHRRKNGKIKKCFWKEIYPGKTSFRCSRLYKVFLSNSQYCNFNDRFSEQFKICFF